MDFHKKERIARKRKTVSSGIEAAEAVAAASSKANNKAAEREQRGSRRGSFIHLLCDFPRTFFPFWKTPFSREAKGPPDHNFPTQTTRIQEKRKIGRNTNRKGVIVATEKWRKGGEKKMPRRSEDCAEEKKRDGNCCCDGNKSARQETRRDETRQASATRRRDSPSLQVSKTTRGLQIEDPK